MSERKKVLPKGFKVKREGRIASDDKIYSTFNSGRWIHPSALMIGKNVDIFITVATPQVGI